jgi:tRNA pseudouridine32 synthase/23S rRNA pseudouridine746 synthase
MVLPTRDGVGPSIVGLPAGPWATLADFLAERFPAVPATVWARRLADGEVVDDEGRSVRADALYRPGGRLHYYREIEAEPRLPFEEFVLFQDELLLAVDKPHFLPVTPSGRHLQETLLVRLKRRLGIDTLAPLHRIDRETAGVVLFSLQPSTRAAYQGLFAQRQVEKVYECIAPFVAGLALPLTRHSRIEEDPGCFMRMREVEGEPNALTHIELLDRQGDLARYRLRPTTGRRHQLRVHCAALGGPIEGDLIYPTLQPVNADDWTRPLQLLAQRIAFNDPVSGQARCFESRRRLSTMGA